MFIKVCNHLDNNGKILNRRKLKKTFNSTLDNCTDKKDIIKTYLEDYHGFKQIHIKQILISMLKIYSMNIIPNW